MTADREPDPATEQGCSVDPDRWGLVVRPEPSDVPAVNRLRAWLKLGLRRFGLKVESIGAGVPVRVVYVERPRPKRKAKV